MEARAAPYSHNLPQVSRDAGARSMQTDDIDYLSLGRELGRNLNDPAFRGPHGLLDGDAIAATPLYQERIKRLTDLARARRTAFMCSQGDPTLPAQCHRQRLAARRATGLQVRHILGDGT